jgi:hypothetical protein
MQADDVLSLQRQQEIAQLIEVLKNFHPTKIAIEADVESEQARQNYSDYMAGKYTLSRDETNQIGYRLAKELGHQTVYPVNVEGEFPVQRVANYAKAHGRAEKFDAMMASAGTRVKEQNDFLLSHTVLETLDLMNSDTMVATDVALYYASVPYGEPGDYAGPDPAGTVVSEKYSHLPQHRRADRISERQDSCDLWGRSPGMAPAGHRQRRDS